ncbi:glycosyltransferase family 32 protein [Acerihabitans sp.]|uniref:glycosyltransferase family 32 protein n=1 Tax=Acerihabitans sp. TaxID=2811394 RepID=UPI002ED79D20
MVDYDKTLSRWISEVQSGRGECRDIAAVLIKDSVDTGKVLLNLSGYNLSSLPILPPHIEELNISNNALETLPSLPDSLKILDASHNKIRHFPVMAPDSLLEKVNLANNLLRKKPTSERPLPVLDLSENPLCFIIPKIIHHIWLGYKSLPCEAITNIVNNAALNPDYTLMLWVDNPAQTQSQLVDSGVTSAFFKRVDILLPTAPYQLEAAIQRECADTPYNNYAAASDILRLSVLKDYGGIYMDVDIALNEPLGDILIENENNQPAVESLFKVDLKKLSDGGDAFDINNNVIAALADSRDVDFLLNAIIAAYQGKRFTFGPDGKKHEDYFKEEWSHNSGVEFLTNHVKRMEISRTAIQLKKSGKFDTLALLRNSEKIKSLEALSQFKKNLFNENVEMNDVMWGLKRERPLVRYTGTLSFTGPALIRSFLFDEKHDPFIIDKIQNDSINGFHSTRKLINSGIFGHIEGPLGAWKPENKGSGGWIAPAVHGWSAEV